ncbi:MAG: DeoR/GlpR family DNA-binding transcription regulator [Eubacteriaceae bacterium]
MYKIQRQEQILQYIYEKKEVSVMELSELFNVSEVTIRKDLCELSKKGKVVKTHGGATYFGSIADTKIPYYKRDLISVKEKNKIGACAASLIKEGEIIFVDAGSTTNNIVPYLEDKEITVVTCDIRIAYRLIMYPKITLVVSGGYSQNSIFALVGSMSEEMFRNTRADMLFLSLDAIDFDYGISYKTLYPVAVKKAMMDSAKKVVAIFDSSKTGKKSFAKLCDIEDIDVIITDAGIDEIYKKKFQEKGVEVIIAN